jgi:HEPN domain-containing protein
MPPEVDLSPDQPHAWIRRAESDLLIASHKLDGSLLEDHCYHAQQCVEKALKGLFVHLDIRVPNTHDVSELFTTLQGNACEVPDHFDKADRLTAYAVRGRYPGFDEPVVERDWEEAVSIARQVLEWAQMLIDVG